MEWDSIYGSTFQVPQNALCNYILLFHVFKCLVILINVMYDYYRELKK